MQLEHNNLNNSWNYLSVIYIANDFQKQSVCEALTGQPASL